MAKGKSGRRLTNLAGTGLRELPGNAAWLLSRALKPAVSASSGVSDVATSVAGNVSGTASSAAETAGCRHRGRAAQDQGGGAVGQGRRAGPQRRLGRIAAAGG